MQVCDILYGITQQERGVSKRVAVRFDQVASDGRIAHDAVRDQEKQDGLEAEAEPIIVEPQTAEQVEVLEPVGVVVEPGSNGNGNGHADEPTPKQQLASMLTDREPVEVETN